MVSCRSSTIRIHTLPHSHTHTWLHGFMALLPYSCRGLPCRSGFPVPVLVPAICPPWPLVSCALTLQPIDKAHRLQRSQKLYGVHPKARYLLLGVETASLHINVMRGRLLPFEVHISCSVRLCASGWVARICHIEEKTKYDNEMV